MYKDKLQSSYIRAGIEQPSTGNSSGKRPEISLDEARTELAQSLNRLIQSLLHERYVPLAGALSELTINEILKSFEELLIRIRTDATLVAEEIVNRMIKEDK